jgi:hypothetical protein
MNTLMTRSGRLNFDEACLLAMAIDANWITTHDIRIATYWRYRARPQLGQLALCDGKLRVADVFRILERQASYGGLFGESALMLGYMDKEQLNDLLLQQVEQTPTLLEAFCVLGILTTEQANELIQRCNDDLKQSCNSIVV